MREREANTAGATAGVSTNGLSAAATAPQGQQGWAEPKAREGIASGRWTIHPADHV
jgi:hypothetical protein